MADSGQTRESRRERRGQSRATGHEVIQLLELRDGDRARQFVHPVVEREEVMVRRLVAVTPGLVDEQEHPPGEVRIVRRHQPALAGGDVLALLQAEAANVAPHADLAAADLGAKRLGAVFDDRNSSPAGQLHDLAHAARIAEEVGDHDRLGARAERGLDRVGRHVVRERIDVGEHGDCRLVDDRRQSAHVGDRRRYHFVARLGIDGRQRRMERGRAVRAGVRTLGPQVGGKVFFKALHEHALRARERAAFNGRRQLQHLVVAQLPPAGVLVRGKLQRRADRFQIGSHCGVSLSSEL